LTKLLEERFFDAWLVDEKKAKENLREATTAELQERVLKLLDPVGLMKWKERFSRPESTVRMADATPEQIANAIRQGHTPLDYILDYDGNLKVTPALEQSSELSGPKVGVNDDKLPTLATEPTVEPVESVLAEALGGPVVFHPEQGQPVLIKERSR
jgi:hypothetical protein